MSRLSLNSKYQPLWITALALVLLPLAFHVVLLLLATGVCW